MVDRLQRRELTGLTRAGTTEQRLVLRARIVLQAARGHPTTQIATSLGACEDTVRRWRRRLCASPGVAALGDAKRCGRPPVFIAVQQAQAVTDGICDSISASTVGRRLRQDAIKPWQYQSWIFICDPDFAATTQRVLGLYARSGTAHR